MWKVLFPFCVCKHHIFNSSLPRMQIFFIRLMWAQYPLQWHTGNGIILSCSLSRCKCVTRNAYLSQLNARSLHPPNAQLAACSTTQNTSNSGRPQGETSGERAEWEPFVPFSQNLIPIQADGAARVSPSLWKMASLSQKRPRHGGYILYTRRINTELRAWCRRSLEKEEKETTFIHSYCTCCRSLCMHNGLPTKERPFKRHWIALFARALAGLLALPSGISSSGDCTASDPVWRVSLFLRDALIYKWQPNDKFAGAANLNLCMRCLHETRAPTWCECRLSIHGWGGF